MERHRRGKGKRQLLGSHQKCWIWGRHAVLETLTAARWPILDLCLSADLPEGERESALARARRDGVPVRVESSALLEQLCHSTEHQGYLARMSAFPYAEEDAVLREAGPAPAFAILDGVQDPHNLGAMVRSAEVLGLDGVFIGEAGQVGVTSMVVRSSAGAVNRVPIVRVADLEALAGRLAGHGVRLVAATEKAEAALDAFDFTGPVAAIIGNEGVGIRPSLLAACQARVSIPQCGQIGSLNAAVAAAIVFYEIRRQRGRPTRGSE
jgi:23S rRNA (guanosine2251-2'-O)-methyltransferase